MGVPEEIYYIGAKTTALPEAKLGNERIKLGAGKIVNNNADCFISLRLLQGSREA